MNGGLRGANLGVVFSLFMLPQNTQNGEDGKINGRMRFNCNT